MVVIKIDSLSPVPIYMQLRNQVILGIASKQLVPGEALPSARRLSADLSINLHTVNKSYALLSDEGYIVTDRKKGTLISHPNKNETEIKTLLSEKLLLAAAEAISHSIDENEFINLCLDNYNKAKLKSKEGH
jgi:DNA-binding transcriptional regulator YhcF (GntR family)